MGIRQIIFTTMSILISSCTSKLVIQSEPPQVEVSVAIEGQAEKIKLGQTPLEIEEAKLNETLKLTSDSAQWIQFIFEKKDFETKTVYLPSNRFGELTKTFKIQMKTMDANSTTVVKMMRHFFNAKKFAETRQFEQAHQEIDKVIALDSQIPQAYSMKGGIYFLQSQMDQAANYYTKAIQIDPSFDEAIKMLDTIKNKDGKR